MARRSLEKQLRNHRLTTAEIIYHLPDHPQLLQTFIWQCLDTAPRFPAIRHFLEYWERCLDGRIHTVKVASAHLIKPAEFRFVDGEFRLH